LTKLEHSHVFGSYLKKKNYKRDKTNQCFKFDKDEMPIFFIIYNKNQTRYSKVYNSASYYLC